MAVVRRLLKSSKAIWTGMGRTGWHASWMMDILSHSRIWFFHRITMRKGPLFFVNPATGNGWLPSSCQRRRVGRKSLCHKSHVSSTSRMSRFEEQV